MLFTLVFITNLAFFKATNYMEMLAHISDSVDKRRPGIPAIKKNLSRVNATMERSLDHPLGQFKFSAMLRFIAPLSAYASWISNFLFGTFRMTRFAEPIRKIQRIKSLSGEEAKRYRTETQNRMSNIMIKDIRNVFYLSTMFSQDRVINDEITFFAGNSFEPEQRADTVNDVVHE